MSVNPREWEEEGIMEGLMGADMDLLFFQHYTLGISHFILLSHGEKVGERRFLWKLNPEEKLLMDAAKEEWVKAKKAWTDDDEEAAMRFTYRGLRIVFPDMPPEPA